VAAWSAPAADGAAHLLELRHPLGLTIVGCLIVIHVLTLFTKPVIYLAFDRLAGGLRGFPLEYAALSCPLRAGRESDAVNLSPPSSPPGPRRCSRSAGASAGIMAFISYRCRRCPRATIRPSRSGSLPALSPELWPPS